MFNDREHPIEAIDPAIGQLRAKFSNNADDKAELLESGSAAPQKRGCGADTSATTTRSSLSPLRADNQQLQIIFLRCKFIMAR
jgi:hypothetical protein